MFHGVPLIVLCCCGPEALEIEPVLGALGNVSLIERPVRIPTMLSVVRAALRARERQYQARDHKTLPFRGRKQGAHPILYDATRNNVFADALEDAPEVRVRLLPVFADLGGRARELVMDRFPWTYAIMAAEMERENKISPPPHDAEPTKKSRPIHFFIPAPPTRSIRRTIGVLL